MVNSSPMRKRCWGHLRSSKPQISLHIFPVWGIYVSFWLFIEVFIEQIRRLNIDFTWCPKMYFLMTRIIYTYFQVIAITGLLALVLPQLADTFLSKCREPKNLSNQLDKLYEELLNMTLTGTSTFGIIPQYRKTPEFEKNQVTSLESQRLNFRIYGDSKCKRLRPLRGKKHLNYKSTCPWFVNLEYDVDRLPQTMAKAECSCRSCFNVNGDGKSGKCEKVLSYVPVIRRTCGLGDEYKYAVYMETVPVGCTCTRNILTSGLYKSRP